MTVARLLEELKHGDHAAVDELFTLRFEHLRQLARRRPVRGRS
jgi:hypothetical protein